MRGHSALVSWPPSRSASGPGCSARRLRGLLLRSPEVTARAMPAPRTNTAAATRAMIQARWEELLGRRHRLPVAAARSRGCSRDDPSAAPGGAGAGVPVGGVARGSDRVVSAGIAWVRSTGRCRPVWPGWRCPRTRVLRGVVAPCPRRDVGWSGGGVVGHGFPPATPERGSPSRPSPVVRCRTGLERCGRKWIRGEATAWAGPVPSASSGRWRVGRWAPQDGGRSWRPPPSRAPPRSMSRPAPATRPRRSPGSASTSGLRPGTASPRPRGGDGQAHPRPRGTGRHGHRRGARRGDAPHAGECGARGVRWWPVWPRPSPSGPRPSTPSPWPRPCTGSPPRGRRRDAPCPAARIAPGGGVEPARAVGPFAGDVATPHGAVARRHPVGRRR